MKPLVFFLFLLLVFSGISCSNSNPVDTLIPNEATKGAVLETISVTVTGQQEGKLVKGGKLVEAVAIVPKSILPGQLKPTSLGVLKGLKTRFPECEWFAIWITDDERMFKCGNNLAIAELKEDRISVQGGVPSDKEIEEFNNPSKTGNTELDKLMMSDSEPKLRKPTEEDLALAYAWWEKKHAVEEMKLTDLETLRSNGKRKEADKLLLKDIPDNYVSRIVAKDLSLPVKRVSDSLTIVHYYYRLKFGKAL